MIQLLLAAQLTAYTFSWGAVSNTAQYEVCVGEPWPWAIQGQQVINFNHTYFTTGTNLTVQLPFAHYLWQVGSLDVNGYGPSGFSCIMPTGGVNISWTPAQPVQVQSSQDLLTWWSETNLTGSNVTLMISDPVKFFRVSATNQTHLSIQ